MEFEKINGGYNVVDCGEPIALLRLYNGYLYCEMTDKDRTVVYAAFPKCLNGQIVEEDFYFRCAEDAIDRYLKYGVVGGREYE